MEKIKVEMSVRLGTQMGPTQNLPSNKMNYLFLECYIDTCIIQYVHMHTEPVRFGNTFFHFIFLLFFFLNIVDSY